MKFNEFMSALDDEVKHVCLLYGEEHYFIDKAREKIFERLNLDPKTELMTIDCDTKPEISTIINTIDAVPLFGEKNVVLVKNASMIFGGDLKSPRLEKILRDMQPKNFVIFVVKSVDKRRKLYKIVSQFGAILEAECLKSWEIGNWLKDKLNSLGKRMSRDAWKYYTERVELLNEISLWVLNNEIDRVALNVTGKEITAEDLRKNLLAPPEVSNFSIIDALDEKKAQKAIYLFRVQDRAQKKNNLIVGAMVNHVRQLIQAKFLIARGLKGKKLSEPLAVPVYVAQKIGMYAETYPTKFLEEILSDLAEADFLIKTGRAGLEIMERIIIKICRR